MTWIPRPNGSPQDNELIIEDDSWIKCDGLERCQKGLFHGQTCSDLSDRVLVGAGKGGSVLDIKDASLPDHAHAHNHDGSATYSFPTSSASNNGFVTAGMGGMNALSDITSNSETQSITVDFGSMESSEAFISKILSSDTSKNIIGSDLYPQHMRVYFIFKCY